MLTIPVPARRRDNTLRARSGGAAVCCRRARFFIVSTVLVTAAAAVGGASSSSLDKSTMETVAVESALAGRLRLMMLTEVFSFIFSTTSAVVLVVVVVALLLFWGGDGAGDETGGVVETTDTIFASVEEAGFCVDEITVMPRCARMSATSRGFFVVADELVVVVVVVVVVVSDAVLLRCERGIDGDGFDAATAVASAPCTIFVMRMGCGAAVDDDGGGGGGVICFWPAVGDCDCR